MYIKFIDAADDNREETYRISNRFGNMIIKEFDTDVIYDPYLRFGEDFMIELYGALEAKMTFEDVEADIEFHLC